MKPFHYLLLALMVMVISGCKPALLAPFGYGNAEKFETLETEIINGQLGKAHDRIEAMFKDPSVARGSDLWRLPDYEKVLDVLLQAKELEEIQTKHSDDIYNGYRAIVISHRHYVGAWNQMPGKLRVSKELVEYVNSQNESIRKKIAALDQAYEVEKTKTIKRKKKQELEREQARKAAKLKRKQDRKARERKRLAELKAHDEKIKAEKLQRKRKERQRKKAYSNKLSKIDENAKKAGYKGLNREYGIARFLYYASKDGTLKQGLDHLFFVGLTARDKKVDHKFKLIQAVDGWDIYEFQEWSKDEFVEFSIALPGSELPMEGQHLRDGCYVFLGNITFQTVLGANRIVQKFRRVEIKECQAESQ